MKPHHNSLQNFFLRMLDQNIEFSIFALQKKLRQFKLFLPYLSTAENRLQNLKKAQKNQTSFNSQSTEHWLFNSLIIFLTWAKKYKQWSAIAASSHLCILACNGSRYLVSTINERTDSSFPNVSRNLIAISTRWHSLSKYIGSKLVHRFFPIFGKSTNK